MDCKNCGHEIERSLPLTGLPEESPFVHVSEIPYHHAADCWCDCNKPEPEQAKKQVGEAKCHNQN